LTVLGFQRRLRNLRQLDLATIAEMSRGSVAVIEAGLVHPWPAARKRLAQALSLPEDRLFRPDGWPAVMEVPDDGDQSA
jgi:transcriptional regulator with XRE-family HTH domain